MADPAGQSERLEPQPIIRLAILLLQENERIYIEGIHPYHSI